MLFSICMCTYNRYEYIKYTIDTILDQVNEINVEFEIVVCDSGSTDGTIEYLNSIEIVKLFDIGLINLAKSYIYAFNQASGKYIININDHTYIRLNNIVKCLKELDSTPEIYCVMNNLCAYGHGVKNKKPFESPESKNVPGMLLHHLFIFRKRHKGYFDKKYNRNMWDYDFIMQVLINGGSVAFYKYIFGCEIKINSDDGILTEQRNDHVLNVADECYFKQKYILYFQKLKKYSNDKYSISINKILIRLVNYLFYNMFLDNIFCLKQIQMKYTVNRLPVCDSESAGLKEIKLQKMNKSSNKIVYYVLLKLLYKSLNNKFVKKSQHDNFYLIQKFK